MTAKADSQQLLNEASLYQQQMQGITAQKEALNMQLMEISNALDELEKTKDKEIYKVAGPLIIKSAKTDIKKDMTEKKELIHTRLKVLEKSEDKIKTKMEELRNKLQKAG